MAHKTKRNSLKRERKTRINLCTRILRDGLVELQESKNLVYAESGYTALRIYAGSRMSHADIRKAFLICNLETAFDSAKDNYPVRARY